MADQKDKAQDKRKLEEAEGGVEEAGDHGGSGGNMGAGKSGKEMGGRQPSNSEEEETGSRQSGDH